MRWAIVFGTISDSGGHPTGVTELISSSFIKPTASPSRKICTSWPASAKAFADFIAGFFGSIGQIASVSDFPGTTRVVLAVLTVLVPPLAFLQWRVPGYMTWQPPPGVSRFILFGLAFFILAITLLLPVVLRVDPAELDQRMFTSYATRAMSHSRFWLGFLAGAYAVCSAWLWALLPRLVRAIFTSNKKSIDTGR